MLTVHVSPVLIWIYNTGLMEDYAIRPSKNKRNTWYYFDKMIKLTGSFLCAIGVHGILLGFLSKKFWKSDQITEGIMKKLNEFQLIKTFVYALCIYFLNVADCVKQTSKCLKLLIFKFTYWHLWHKPMSSKWRPNCCKPIWMTSKLL